jgi:hypothetical protein
MIRANCPYAAAQVRAARTDGERTGRNGNREGAGDGIVGNDGPGHGSVLER